MILSASTDIFTYLPDYASILLAIFICARFAGARLKKGLFY